MDRIVTRVNSKAAEAELSMASRRAQPGLRRGRDVARRFRRGARLSAPRAAGA